MKEMNNSESEWFGRIPKDWKISKINELYIQRNQKVNDIDYPPLSVTKKGILYQLKTVAKSNDHYNRKLVKKWDFAINSRSDRRGSCGISEYDGSVSLINIVLKPQKTMNPRYYNWLFHTSVFSDEFYKWGHGIVDDLWTTGWDDMKKINIPYPPIERQQQIADFLDKKCSDIDSAKKDVEKEIEVLKEYKKSVIIQAVTKGLDKNVKMKNSGISFVGNIPDSWEVHPVYYFFQERKHRNILGKEKNLLSLSYGKIIEKDINKIGGLLPENFNTYNIVEPGDIIIRPTDLQNDKRSLRTGLVKEHGIITSAYIDLMPIRNINVEYYHFLLHSFDVMKVFYNMGNGVRQGLNFPEFSKLLIFEPSLTEQNNIVDYLNNKCKEIDFIVSSRQKQLEILDEYKKSLIYEYVTGKKEVQSND